VTLPSVCRVPLISHRCRIGSQSTTTGAGAALGHFVVRVLRRLDSFRRDQWEPEAMPAVVVVVVVVAVVVVVVG